MEERTVYLLFHGDQVALRRRPAQGLLAGLWEYPNELSGEGGPAQWGLSPAALSPAGAGKHIFSHIEWHMSALMGELPDDALPPGWVWADGAALREEYALPSAFRPFQARVEERLGQTWSRK